MKINRKIIIAAMLGLVVFSSRAEASDYAGLKSAIDNSASNTEYTYLFNSDITDVTDALGSMQGANYNLTIDGSSDKWGINANETAGITVNENQTLIIQNIGSYTSSQSDGKITSVTVNKSWNGFKDPLQNRFVAVYNSGTLNISNSVFKANKGKWGGAINSGGTLTVSDSVFSENKSEYVSESSGDEGGGAIFNKTNASISNSIFYKNEAKCGGAIYNKTGGIIEQIINSKFTENKTYTPSDSANLQKFSGGAIYNGGTITLIDNSYFYKNQSANQGAAISNYGRIETISNSVFDGNVSEKDWGTIYNRQGFGGIGTISGVKILNSTGDGINSNFPIGTIVNTTISDGTTYAIQIDGSGNIDLLDNVTISNNQSGGLYIKNNAVVTTIKNSTFTNNGRDKGTASGIWSNTSINLLSDNGTTLFQGNKDKNNPSGIWMNKADTTVTLEQNNSGKMYFYDPIRGSSSTYNVNIAGDGSGTLYLYNNIENAHVSAASTNIDTADGTLFNYNFKSLSSANSANWKIDIDVLNETSDTIKTALLKQTETEYVKIKELNYINADWGSVVDGDTHTVKILTTQNKLQLALDDALQSEQLLKSTEIAPEETYNEAINQTTNWQKIYHSYKKDAIEDNIYATITTARTSTDNDSLHFALRRSTEGGEIHELTTLGDTLRLVNEDTTNAVKNFNAQADGATYTVSEDLGNTKGTVNINGYAGEGTETINLNSHSGFVLGDGAVKLNLNNVTIGGSGTIATVSNGSASVALTDTVLNGAIQGTTAFNMTTGGTTEINGDITNANIANSGILTTTAEHISGSTMTNTNTLNLSGALSKTIGGSGVTKVNTALTFNDGANIDGTLNLNNGALSVSSGAITSHSVGTMNGDGNLNIDLRLSTPAVDSINLANTSSGTVMLNSVNILDPSVTNIAEDFSVKVLNAPSGSAIKLALSSAVQSAFDSKEYVIHTEGESVVTDPINVTSAWTQDLYSKHTTTALTVKGKLGLSDDKLSIKVSESSREGGVTTDTSLGDTLKVVNQDTTNAVKNFNAQSDGMTYTVKEDLGNTKGTVNVNGISGGDAETINFDSYKGFDLSDDNSVVSLKNISVVNANYIAKSTNSTSVINLADVNLDGTNGDGIESSGTVNISGKSVINDKITMNSSGSALNINGTNEVRIGNILSGSGKLNISNGTVNFDQNAKIVGLDSTISNVNINLKDEASFNNVNLTVSGNSLVNTINDSIATLSLGNLNLNSVLNMTVDADLANQQMDQLSASSVSIGSGGQINVSKINLMSPTTQKELSLLFTENSDLANAINYTGDGTIAYSPIYKYKTSYNVLNNMGYFKFGLVQNDSFNPAVLAAPVMNQAGMMANMDATMGYAFQHSDGFTKLRAVDRFAMINRNKYAINDVVDSVKRGVVSTDFNQNLNLSEAYENRGIWVRPYVAFENIPLKNGPRVGANSYGTLVGFDTDFKELKHGWDTVFTGYLGYNGSHLTYGGVQTIMNGGVLGGTQTWYKGNFWTAVTATVGASAAENYTMYGREDNASLMAGVGSKTGYNFEFANGRFIVQPIWFMSYSFMKTFDFTNAAGVRINSDPLHTIQLNPSVRFIGNFEHGWQPYASVGMVWNLMNETQAYANNVKLPEMSIKPYVEYGLGIQKQTGDRFTGFLQAMLRNGGRNGIALTGGFRWALGKDYGKVEKVQNTDSPKIEKTSPIKPVKAKKSNVRDLKVIKTNSNMQTQKSVSQKLNVKTSFEPLNKHYNR